MISKRFNRTMADVRFRIDRDQLGIVLQVMDEFLKERPRGETLNLLHSILHGLAIRLRRRYADRRYDYAMILPVYQALAFRRMCMAGMELYEEGRARTELRILLSLLDPKLTAYTL